MLLLWRVALRLLVNKEARLDASSSPHSSREAAAPRSTRATLSSSCERGEHGGHGERSVEKMSERMWVDESVDANARVWGVMGGSGWVVETEVD